MTKLLLKPLRWLLLAFPDLATVDDHIMLVDCVANLDEPKEN
jgi:hypothetical protein